MVTKTKALTRTLTDIHLTARSGNSKTGPIPVTYRPMSTCPAECPFLGNGCYGTGRIFALANKYAATMRAVDMLAKLAHRDPNARFLRDRVVGDILDGSGAIDHEYVETVAAVAIAAGLIPFGYSHVWRRFTAADVRRIARTGYVMNASCETREDVRRAINLGMPAVIASDILEDGETFERPDGVTLRVVTCPAQTRDDTTCATCGLCARAERRSVVRFHIHGTARRRAADTVRKLEDCARSD